MSISRRSVMLGAAALAGIVGTGTLVWFFVIRQPLPAWKVQLMDLPLVLEPENPNPSTSAQGRARRRYLMNDLRRRDFWGRQEVDEVIAMIEAHPLDLVPQQDVTSNEDWERYFLARDAIGAIRTRLGIGAPIDAAERQRLVDVLLRYSHAASPHIRLSLAETLCWSGLIFEDSRADARVKEMMNDPDPQVAANARGQYRYHTQRRERWGEFQRRRGGGDT